MKIKLLSLFTLACIASTTKAQVLYSEDFDNLTLGNVGTDPTGKTAGQGDWYTSVIRIPYTVPTSIDNPLFTIINEANRGKVLTLCSPTPPIGEVVSAKKEGLNTLVDKRTAGNNVIKFEIDYFTGSKHTSTAPNSKTITLAKSNFGSNKDVIINFYIRTDTGHIQASYSKGNGTESTSLDTSNNSILPFNTWIKLIVYLDYDHNKIYFDTPYFGTVVEKDFLYLSNSSNLLEDYKPLFLDLGISTLNISSTHQMTSKYDNIKITALDKVPLSVKNFISSKFNLYPNPSNDIINITNNENIGVEKVDIFDISGKLVQAKTFNKEAEIQLNISDLASGTYMFHISTTEGTAVKKVVKN